MIKQFYKYPDNLIFTCNFKIELIDVHATTIQSIR